MDAFGALRNHVLNWQALTVSRAAIIQSQNTYDISTLETYYLNFIASELLYAKLAIVF